MEKIDFKKTMKEFYKPSSKKVVKVNVPEMKFIMIDGKGSPGDSQEYLESIASLYPIAFKMKFYSKKKLEKDYVVPPLEGLWWAADMSDFLLGNRDEWLWTMMIMVPEWISKEIFNDAKKHVLSKKKDISDKVRKVRFESYAEGLSAQILHIGPYADEHPTIMRVHKFIKDENGMFNGHQHKHHEIYLSDPRRAKPETMKTVIRQPYKYK